MSQSTVCSNENEGDEAAMAPQDWQLAHQQLTRLARSRAGLDFEEGRWLVAAWRHSVHVHLGYGSFGEYAERLFGYSVRLTQDKLRVAEALELLPAMAAALRRGEICWSMLRELTRVATPPTETEWLAAARGRTVREVERLVSGHGPGSRPGDARDAGACRHVLRFDVSAEVLASMREALSKIRRDAGEPLDDDAALLLMARSVLGGPTDEGRSSYQIALTVCESCQRGQQQGRGELVEVGPEVVEMAACDAQHLGRLQPVTKHAHVGGGTAARATQTTAPAVRRQVLRRDSGRCVVPGCYHAKWLDVHHLEPRAEGGGHQPDNLITLCGAHHRALHRGHLVVEGSVAAGLTFRHADGSPYGAAVAGGAVDVRAKAFQALRGLGFGEGEARRALGQLAHVGGAESVESLVRCCLLLLTERIAQAG